MADEALFGLLRQTANPASAALAMDGKMVDLPHLIAARKILASI